MNIRAFAALGAVALTAAALAVAPADAAPAGAQPPAPAMMVKTPKKVHVRYSCHSLNVPVTYDNVKDTAIVTYGGGRYTLPHVVSADGGRYMNDRLEWWEKGTTATLWSVTDGKARTVLAKCEAIPKK